MCWRRETSLGDPAQAKMTITPEQELWAIALWVEKTQGENGELHIACEMDRLLAAGDLDGVAMWRKIRERFRSLRDRRSVC